MRLDSRTAPRSGFAVENPSRAKTRQSTNSWERRFCMKLLLALAIAVTGFAETHRFEPKEFYNTFSGAHKPVLRIKPGDHVITSTIDAGGTDSAGVRRGQGPNPETGPFFIEGAEPGDTLVVHL